MHACILGSLQLRLHHFDLAYHEFKACSDLNPDHPGSYLALGFIADEKKPGERFVPATKVGFMNLQGLVLFGLYLFGIVMGVLTALLMRKTTLRGPKPPFALMLPEFRRPNLQTVMIQLLGRAKVFLKRAGTVIFAVAVIVWALAYFPRSDAVSPDLDANTAAAVQMEQSWLGRAGKIVEPVFEPLGWDWRVSSAVIAGFPAREVVVAVLGTIYAVGAEADESSLADRLRSATFADGSQVFTLPMVLGLLVFYAWCLQCVATLAVIRRETNSWRWPVFALNAHVWPWVRPWEPLLRCR